MAKTILGAPLSELEIKKRKEKELQLKRADILCSAVLESRESSSISTSKAIDYIIDIANAATDNELISKKQAELLAGRYILAVSRCISKEGYSNGRPSGLVALVKEAHPHLNINMGRPTASSGDADKSSIFEIQSEMFKRYGIKVSPTTLRDWDYSKP